MVGISYWGPYKYYVIRDGVGGGKGKDNTLITCPGWEGVGVGKKITDNLSNRQRFS